MTDSPPFSFRTTAAGEVRITWGGRVVTTLRGGAGQRFLRRVASTNDPQAEMARVTGNFKRGNERSGSHRKGIT